MPAEMAASPDDVLLAESLVSLSLTQPPAASPPAPDAAPQAAQPARKRDARPRTAVLFQPVCTGHRYIRTSDNSTIVERPERIRAVKVGVAAAFARLERHAQTQRRSEASVKDELDTLLQGLSLDGNEAGKPKAPVDLTRPGRPREIISPEGPFDILDSRAQLAVDHAALAFVHPVPNRPPHEEDDWESASGSSSSGPAAGPPKAQAPTSPWPAQLRDLCRGSASLQAPSDPSAAPTSSPSRPSHRRPSEIPAHLPQGDLYLCPESEAAIFGALGACCEGVDRIVRGSRSLGAEEAGRPSEGGERYDRAFVAIRPPGHHCGEANPQGFCFVNNVAVAAAHAHLEHGVDRVVIFDIDLHHGNGTQELAWRINASAHRILEARERDRERAALAAEMAAAGKTPRSSPRKSSPRKNALAGIKKEEVEEGGAAAERNPLRIMYSSLHDIWSYPCEDGDPALVSAASLNLSGGHGQFISNVHLEPWASETDFHERLHPRYRYGLLGAAEEFVRRTRGPDEAEEAAKQRTMVIVSLGCDASEHESAGMSRHNRNVPTSFYRRFALDATTFARTHAGGKCLAVLEGGYSDRALASASAAFLSGFSDNDADVEASPQPSAPFPTASKRTRFESQRERDSWWSEPLLKKLEKACSVAKGRRGAPPSGALVGATGADAIAESWLTRAVDVFSLLEDIVINPPTSTAATTTRPEGGDRSGPRQLRDRRTRPVNYAQLADGASPASSPGGGGRRATPALRKSASASRLRAVAAAADEPLPPPVPPVPPVAPHALEASRIGAPSPTAQGADPSPASAAAPADFAPFASAPTTFAAPTAAESRPIDPEPAPETKKPSIRFTWKQGGFAGEPRM